MARVASNSKNHSLRNPSIPRITRYASTTLQIWAVAEKNSFGRKRILQVSTKQKKVQFVLTEITSMKNTFPQTHSTSKFTLLGRIICMPKPGSPRLWTGWSSGTRKENKWDILSFLLQIKSIFQIASLRSSGRIFVVSICSEPMESPMSAM